MYALGFHFHNKEKGGNIYYYVESFDIDGSYYLSNEKTLKIGGAVLVPFGRDDEWYDGTIVGIDFLLPEKQNL